MFTVYKIRNADGLYSKGGTDPSWTKRGKVWQNKQGLSSHLGYFCKNTKYNQATGKTEIGWWNNIPSDWTIEELSPEGLKEYPAREIRPETTGFR